MEEDICEECGHSLESPECGTGNHTNWNRRK